MTKLRQAYNVSSGTTRHRFLDQHFQRRLDRFASHHHPLALQIWKFSGVNPHAWFTDTLTRLVNQWPVAFIDELMPRVCGRLHILRTGGHRGKSMLRCTQL